MQTALKNFVLDYVVLAVEQTTYVGDLEIAQTTRLADDLQLGQFGMLKLALYLEEMFDIELSDEDLSRLVTVGDIVQHLLCNYFVQVKACALLSQSSRIQSEQQIGTRYFRNYQRRGPSCIAQRAPDLQRAAWINTPTS
jgi:acyl carrier protein